MKHLYKELMDLSVTGDTFYFKDFLKDDIIYRIFNYRLSSYSEFMKPGALECRGIMFSVDEDGNYIDIKSRPMSKFFNLNENPSVIGLDLNNVVSIFEKADGSLISSYEHNGNVYLKSKGSLESDQALDALEYLYDFNNQTLLDFIRNLLDLRYTVNLEWCSPDNRIVLSYDKPQLKILNIRHNDTGVYLDYNEAQFSPWMSTVLKKYAVEEIKVDDNKTFIESVSDMKESIEGFVCKMIDGTFFKIKTSSYITLHHSKDSINSPRRLYEAVLEEATDDLKSLFFDDTSSILLIEEMEKFVEFKISLMIKEVSEFYENYKNLTRKDYAIKGQKEITKLYFPLIMNLYLDKDFSFKDFMIKKWKEFGINDQV